MNWIKQEQKFIFQTYKRQPLVLVKGRGSYVWDVQGKKYLDCFSGLAVNNLGHCFPAVVKAVTTQVRQLIHTSNAYYTLPQIRCAERLIAGSFPGKVFFCNSGAEANECALKLARRWSKKFYRGNEIIVFRNSFHGRTLGTLTLTGQEKYRKAFDPLVEKALYAGFNDIASVKKLISKKTCAIFVEPVQGEGGVNVASKNFLVSLRKLCNQNHLLLVLDEVQCGLGRSGRLFSFEHYGIIPDIVTLAKGLGGGLPIGAVIAKDSVASLFGRGDHASTFGGNPVVCSAAEQVLKALDQKFLRTVVQKGERLTAGLLALQKKFPSLIHEIRGLGLMIGCELKIPGDSAVDFCREHGLLVNCTQENVIRFLPPLNVSFSDIQNTLKIFEQSLNL